ncbi:MAG: hypothetical protein H7246_12520 [Phycisphaerae bacterium]|nr:hypothetical protein [Saprospiraceae bacterium]
MAFEKISERVRQLIQENDQRAAADLLMQAFRDKNLQLFNIALVQQANIKKLADQSAAGILSPDEINREQAKTNAALLHLSDEHARLYERAASAKSTGLPRWVLLAGGALVLVLVGWLMKNALGRPDYPKTFDVEVILHDKAGENISIGEGEVNLRLGEVELQSRLPLDASGKATFKDLSEKFRGDSVRLLYFPPKARRFNIINQSAAILSGQRQSIRFALEFLPDTTVYEGGLRDSKGRAISEAQITIDGTLHATSDAKGYFKLAIPKANGASAYFEIEKNGKRLLKQDVTISSGYHEISIQ